MELTLFPLSESPLPEGMAHPPGTPCPLDDLGHPRGATCCSLDATIARLLCVEEGAAAFAALLESDMAADQAHRVGLMLRDAYASLVTFSRWCPPRRGFVNACEEAQANGAGSMVRPFVTNAEMALPIGHAAEWLLRTGEAGFGARAERLPEENE